MSLIGMTYDEAFDLVEKQRELTDQLRQLVTTAELHVDSLANANYISATTQALMNKWHGETRPQFDKIFARSAAAQDGTIKAIRVQESTQNDGAAQCVATGI